MKCKNALLEWVLRKHRKSEKLHIMDILLEELIRSVHECTMVGNKAK